MKDAIIHRSRITPRRIEHQVRIVTRFLFPLPIDVVGFAKDRARLQAKLVITTDRRFEFFKPVVKRGVGSAKNGGGRLLTVRRRLVTRRISGGFRRPSLTRRVTIQILFQVINVNELNGIRDHPTPGVLVTQRYLGHHRLGFWIIAA